MRHGSYSLFRTADDDDSAGVASDVGSTSSTLATKNGSQTKRSDLASTPEVATSSRSSERWETVAFSTTAEKPLTKALQTPVVGYTESLPGTIKLQQPAAASSQLRLTDDDAQVSFAIATTFQWKRDENVGWRKRLLFRSQKNNENVNLNGGSSTQLTVTAQNASIQHTLQYGGGWSYHFKPLNRGRLLHQRQ